ncbi:hypothetical protein FF38_13256 [Lucilia cuprina]|uniref:Uncharacterized protein n=1 Tax=Lucilia cuprina TaxID=7375 RepID=A0A0L0CKD6_LUCCU|nr:hypothetical protein FF38_13256 [Lucilia cuprina]
MYLPLVRSLRKFSIPKRVELFSELQVLLDYNPRKMLHPSQTRWLSLEATIDINNSTFLKDPKDIYLGAEVSLALTKLSEEREKDFRNHCLQFYVELCNSLLKKFDFENDFLECVEVIAPANIVKNNNKSIFKLCSFVPNVVEMNYIQETDDEWRELLHINFEDLGLLEEENIETFWEVIFKTKRGDGTKANLKKLEQIRSANTVWNFKN